MSTEMMVDVLFILLIFFILISNIKKDSVKIKTAKVDKQKSAGSDKKTKEHVLTIDKKNIIYFNGKKISMKKLLTSLKKAKKETPKEFVPVIMLRTDANSSSGKLLEVFLHLNQAGLSDNVQCEVDNNP
ncbi:biopolymer transporter ExbD [Candidatus Uabimicrobium sp. HlEnr_7]|uniref:biopolymer transporter ExbD n=1 Tax=Candidatus Uabimicrobium helgolandensis TaxID=3095367 RepID=UPI00355738A8